MTNNPLAIAQMTVRIGGSLLLLLGLVVWTGNADAFVSIHMLLGIVVVGAFWAVAYMAYQAGVKFSIVGLATIWGIVTALLGLAQQKIVLNGGHWVVQVLHLAVGLGLIGIAEVVGAQIKRQRVAV